MQKQRDKDPTSRLSVRLTRKFAEFIDGVNLTDVNVGDRLDLSRHDAEVLIAEGWAEPQSLAADRPRKPSASLGVALSKSKGKKTARR